VARAARATRVACATLAAAAAGIALAAAANTAIAAVPVKAARPRWNATQPLQPDIDACTIMHYPVADVYARTASRRGGPDLAVAGR
jgi:hypothetical protein